MFGSASSELGHQGAMERERALGSALLVGGDGSQGSCLAAPAGRWEEPQRPYHAPG
jgi:hypothetical protein